MTPNAHIHVCARCKIEHNGIEALPPPGWVWRGSRLHCDSCAGCVDDPVDDAAPRAVDADTARQSAPFMVASAMIVDLTFPDPAHILIEDIALPLSRHCRLGGHASRFFSYAEYSVILSRRVPPEAALAALLSQSPKAYIGPVNPALINAFPGIGHCLADARYRIERAVDIAFSVDGWRWRTEIGSAQVDLDVAEALRFMPENGFHWGTAREKKPRHVIECWSADEARRRFLERFRELTATAVQQEAA
jgi:hypothetical protein